MNFIVVVVVVSLIITLSTAKLHQFCRLKLYEIKYNIIFIYLFCLFHHKWQGERCSFYIRY